MARVTDRARNVRSLMRGLVVGSARDSEAKVGEVQSWSPIYPPKTPVDRRQSVTSVGYPLAAFALVSAKLPQLLTESRRLRSVTRGRGFKSRRPDQGNRSSGPVPRSGTVVLIPSVVPIWERTGRRSLRLISPPVPLDASAADPAPLPASAATVLRRMNSTSGRLRHAPVEG